MGSGAHGRRVDIPAGAIVIDAAVGAILVSLFLGLAGAVAWQSRQHADLRERVARVESQAGYSETLFNREMALVWRELQRIEKGRR